MSQQCQPDEVCHNAGIHLQQSVQSRPHATRHDIIRASQWVYSSSKPVHRGFGVVVMAKRTTRVGRPHPARVERRRLQTRGR